MASKKNEISLKGWLEGNRIYFETIAALLLSIMAIIMSYQQVSISEKQTELLEKQKIIADTELKKQMLSQKISYLKDWNEIKSIIRNGEWLFENSYWSGELVKEFFKNMTIKEKKGWVDNFIYVIKPIGANRVIIENRILYENYLAIEYLIYRLQRDYTNIKYGSLIRDFDEQDLFRVWRHFKIINMFMNRPAKSLAITSDSSFMPSINLWQMGTDSLLNEIDSLIKENKHEVEF